MLEVFFRGSVPPPENRGTEQLTYVNILTGKKYFFTVRDYGNWSNINCKLVIIVIVSNVSCDCERFKADLRKRFFMKALEVKGAGIQEANGISVSAQIHGIPLHNV